MSIKQELMEGQMICRSEQKLGLHGKVRTDQTKIKQRAGPCLLFLTTRKTSLLSQLNKKVYRFALRSQLKYIPTVSGLS